MILRGLEKLTTRLQKFSIHVFIIITFHYYHQNSSHRNITKCYNKSITQRDKLLIKRRRNHMSITEKQRQQQAELHKNYGRLRMI